MARSEYWSCPLRLPTPAAAELALVRHHDRAHLVKQELVGDTAEPRDSLLQPGGQYGHRLPAVETQPQQPPHATPARRTQAFALSICRPLR